MGKTVDGEKRFFIEPWDVLVPVVRRSGVLGKLYGSGVLRGFLSSKRLRTILIALMDFGYFSEVKRIEREWNEVHSKTMDEDTLSDIEARFEA